MSNYVEISRDDVEQWLDTLVVGGTGTGWEPVAGTAGLYRVILSDAVAVTVSTSLRAAGTVVDRAKGSTDIRLTSRVSGRTINRKATGQSKFYRTAGWRERWSAGVLALAEEYQRLPAWYDRIATEDSPREQARAAVDTMLAQVRDLTDTRPARPLAGPQRPVEGQTLSDPTDEPASPSAGILVSPEGTPAGVSSSVDSRTWWGVRVRVGGARPQWVAVLSTRPAAVESCRRAAASGLVSASVVRVPTAELPEARRQASEAARERARAERPPSVQSWAVLATIRGVERPLRVVSSAVDAAQIAAQCASVYSGVRIVEVAPSSRRHVEDAATSLLLRGDLA